MLAFDDPRWAAMCGGYRVPYDPRPVLKALRTGGDQRSAWEEFWNELHHQGDVGEASYAVVPHLVDIQKANGNLDWNFYVLVSTIELERHRKANPRIPDWLHTDYKAAWADMAQLALRDFVTAPDVLTQRVILGAVALSKGLLKCGALLTTFDESELLEILDTHMAWSDLYHD